MIIRKKAIISCIIVIESEVNTKDSLSKSMKTDIEIAHENEMEKIKKVTKKLSIPKKYLIPYGRYMAKIDGHLMEKLKEKEDGHLVLVTSTNPTPFGEGKTTMAIGIHDALCHLGYSSLAVLREPSLGPVFGLKGGATGGGYAQVMPMEQINLHFTGDMHALTSANNLLCAAIDNHIMQGNELRIDPTTIQVPRALDMNDRSLRHITIAQGKNNGVERKDQFVITVATELMAILCLSKDLKDLKQRISNIMIAFNTDGKPLYVRDLHCEGAMSVLLKDAMNPNVVQTLEHNPVLIHGGPFANIAHGCNSLIATKMGLKLADYVVTEAGFGADLGATKFLDIKCRIGNLAPSLIVLNTTIRSLKYNAGISKEEVEKPNIEALKKGIVNLDAHLDLLSNFTKSIVVCINHFIKDTEEEIAFVKNYVEKRGFDCKVSKAFEQGGKGSLELAKSVVEKCHKQTLKTLYKVEDKLEDKIETMVSTLLHSKVLYTDEAKKDIQEIKNLNLEHYPICIAKTPYSLTDQAKKLGYPKNEEVTVKHVKVETGAGFIIVYMGNIMTMPGLPKKPNLLSIDLDEQDQIVGLF